MIDRPIIFSAPMVRALLDGRKSQTRRVLKPQPDLNEAGLWRYPPDVVCNGSDPNRWVKQFGGFCQTDDDGLKVFLSPCGKRNFLRYAPSDRLWVREAFSYETLDVDRNGFMPPWYWADGNQTSGNFTRPKPSIHMPRWASRITLTVTDVRVQRLQEITLNDTIAEGIEATDIHARRQRACLDGSGECGSVCRDSFHELWNSLHGPGAWDRNPWVAALTFTVEHRNIDEADK